MLSLLRGHQGLRRASSPLLPPWRAQAWVGHSAARSHWARPASGMPGCPPWPRGCPGVARMWLQAHPSCQATECVLGGTDRGWLPLPPTPLPAESQLPGHRARGPLAPGCSWGCQRAQSPSTLTHMKTCGVFGKVFVLAHAPVTDKEQKYPRDLKVR